MKPHIESLEPRTAAMNGVTAPKWMRETAIFMYFMITAILLFNSGW